MPRDEFQRRAEQLEDVIELITASGFRLVAGKSGEKQVTLEMVKGDYDEYVVAAYVELEEQ